MPLKKYEIKDNITGATMIVERDKPPSKSEIASIFSSKAPAATPAVPAVDTVAAEKKLGYWGRVAQPFAELPGKVGESYTAASNAPVTPGAEVPAAAGRAGGVVAETVMAPIGAGLSSLDQLLGGKIGPGIMNIASRLGQNKTLQNVGVTLARTSVGKKLYEIGTDPEQAANLRALGAASGFLGMGGAKILMAKAAEKGLIGQKTPKAIIKATSKMPATEALYRKLPAAMVEKIPTTTEGLKGLSGNLVKYGLEKYVDPLRYSPRKLEDEAHNLFVEAANRADESLLKNARGGVFKGTKEKGVNIMETFDEAVMSEIDKGTKGILSDEFPNAFDRVKHLRDVYAREWSGVQPVEKALEFKRDVLRNKQQLFKDSRDVTPEGPIDAEIKKLVYKKLNEKLADISPEFKKFNNMANDLASIKEAAADLRSKTGKAPDWSTISGQIKNAAVPIAKKAFTGDIPGTKVIPAALGNMQWPGMTRWSLKDLITGKIATEAPRKFGVPYAAPLRKELTTPISYPDKMVIKSETGTNKTGFIMPMPTPKNLNLKNKQLKKFRENIRKEAKKAEEQKKQDARNEMNLKQFIDDHYNKQGGK